MPCCVRLRPARFAQGAQAALAGWLTMAARGGAAYGSLLECPKGLDAQARTKGAHAGLKVVKNIVRLFHGVPLGAQKLCMFRYACAL